MQTTSNNLKCTPSSSRRFAVVLTAFAAIWAGVWGLGRLALEAPTAWAAQASPASALRWLCAGGVALLVIWLAFGVLAAAIAQGRGHNRWARGVHRWTPAASRRLAALLLGASVVGVAPAYAQIPAPVSASVTALATDPGPGWRVATPPTPSPSPGWSPSAPVVRPTPAPALVIGTPRRAAAEQTAGHVVIRGDSLWSIAAAALGPGATTAEIASEWPRWYAANRHLIGEDPDRLAVGLQLRAPAQSNSAGAR